MYSGKRVFPLLQEIGVAEANGEVRFFDQKLVSRRVCACAVKIGQKSLIVLWNRHNFSHFIRNRGRWTRRWGQLLDRKQNWRYFCECALKKSQKHSENVFRQKSYSPDTGNLRRRSEWRDQIFYRTQNRRFCECAVKNRPQTRLLCCQIVKILAPLWAIAVAEHDGI